MIWGFVESFSLILVLLRMATNNNMKGYPHNFINDFCDPPHKCDAIIIRIIFYKLLTSIALVVGVKYRWTIALIPWLLVNVLGIFPYSLVATSALYDYNIVAMDGYIGLTFRKNIDVGQYILGLGTDREDRTVRFYDVDGVDMVRLFSCRISFAKLVMLVVSYLNGVDWNCKENAHELGCKLAVSMEATLLRVINPCHLWNCNLCNFQLIQLFFKSLKARAPNILFSLKKK
ncbi:hypothetical protein HA402_000043 [Bradysia odoriphaga]|nr:hypothetical protein HA402_000043 [Bradysia odoriphaga]